MVLWLIEAPVKKPQSASNRAVGLSWQATEAMVHVGIRESVRKFASAQNGSCVGGW